jgi:hypothetical protein
VEWLLGPKHRTLPFQWELVPYNNAGADQFFTAT